MIDICRILRNPTIHIEMIENELNRVCFVCILVNNREQVVVVPSLHKVLWMPLSILALQDHLVVML